MSKKNFFLLLLFTACFVWTTADTAKAVKPYCGDSICSSKENSCNCPSDCGAAPSSEENCTDGIDNDCDEFIDCDDEDCDAVCGPTPFCGDGECNGDETCSSCELDCGVCPPPSCNSDGVCNLGEDCHSCPNDCAGVTGGKPSNRYCCGLDTCSEALCGKYCGSPPNSEPVCGNGVIETGEQCDDSGESKDCDSDCTFVICGDGILNITAGEQCDDGDNIPGDGCDENCFNEALSVAPLNQFNIGDSIGEGEAADGTIGEAHHDKVWSTGYDVYDIVYSLNERFEDADPVYYGENSVTMDVKYNKAISGAVMSDFVSQANNVVAEATAMGSAGMVTILIGNNDVCKSSLDSMTDIVSFESQYRAGLDVLAASNYTKYAEIHVSSIPDIYWLWVAKKDSSGCRLIWWFGSVCQVLLQNPSDDCESVASRDDPDNIYPGDGLNCQRRKEFHRRIRNVYNPILKNVLAEYINNGKLPNAYYADIFEVKFTSSEVNNGDCFHPSTAGHKLLADEEWCKSLWSINDPLCTP